MKDWLVFVVYMTAIGVSGGDRTTRRYLAAIRGIKMKTLLVLAIFLMGCGYHIRILPMTLEQRTKEVYGAELWDTLSPEKKQELMIEESQNERNFRQQRRLKVRSSQNSSSQNSQRNTCTSHHETICDVHGHCQQVYISC